MKRGFKFQTGEIFDIANEIRMGKIPEVEFDNDGEYKELIYDLKKQGVVLAEEYEIDKTAVDKVKFPEFQFRATFYIDNDKSKAAYIDFYTEDPPEETYADVFGD